MHLILIGNFPSDKQESMNRFALMLESGFKEAGHTAEIWKPKTYTATWASSTLSGIGKWLGYIDKWIIFPITLRYRLLNKNLTSHNVHFHICDHSNAPYLKHLPRDRTGITCHDVLAIRGSLGYADAYCPATSTGKVLQQWILGNLKRSKRLASVSQFTLNQLYELSSIEKTSQKNWRVIHNAFNAPFYPMHLPERVNRLASLNLDKPFILHVGSGLPRKNRKLLLDMVTSLGDKWLGVICFAGQAVDEKLMAHARSLNLENRIISVVKPDHITLVALYSGCDAFIFPSFSEGFGWPVIEAQACGAPVIASNIEPMPEVSGGAAFHADADNPEAFASSFLLLKNKVIRSELIRKGFENCSRFRSTHMINQYLTLHGVEQKELETL